MKAVSTLHRSAPPAVSAPRIDLKALMEPLLAPVRQLQAWQPIAAEIQHMHPLSLDAKSADKARERHELLPAGTDLNRTEGRLLAVLDEPAEEPQARLLLGVMLDGLRSRPNESAATYIETLVWTLQDDPEKPPNPFEWGAPPYSAEVLAAVVRRVWRESVFPPAAAELLKECRDVKRKMHKGLADVRRMQELRDNAEDVLIEAGESHLLDLGEEWPEEARA